MTPVNTAYEQIWHFCINNVLFVLVSRFSLLVETPVNTDLVTPVVVSRFSLLVETPVNTDLVTPVNTAYGQIGHFCVHNGLFVLVSLFSFVETPVNTTYAQIRHFGINKILFVSVFTFLLS